MTGEGFNDGGMTAMYFRKAVLTGLAVVAIGAGWLAKTIAQESSSFPAITYFNHEKVDDSFAKGGPTVLFAGQSGQRPYKVMTTSRVQTSGEAEIHSHTVSTNVVYVVSGAATFVIGRTAVAAKRAAPDGTRGQPMPRGESYRLSKGDLMIVPPGVPHWYEDVETPFRYLVVEIP